MKKPAKLTSWLIPKLRQASRYWPEKSAARALARRKVEVGTFQNGNVKHKTVYECAECTRQGLTELHEEQNTQMDHINPVVGVNGFTNWDNYILGLFCDRSNYECLCIPHHAEKTAKENQNRYIQKIEKIRANSKDKDRKLTKLSRKKASKKIFKKSRKK